MPYRLADLLSSFGLAPAKAIPKFHSVNAHLGGSAALYLVRKYTANFTPGDLDIFIQPSANTKQHLKRLVAFLGKAGYTLDKEETITSLSAVIILTEDEDEIPSTYGGTPNDHINEVWTFRHPALKKKLQLVMVDVDPRQYICKHTDLSCTAIAIELSYSATTVMDAAPLYALKQNKMYVMEDYQGIANRRYENPRLRKLSDRISKYEERGLTLSDEPPSELPDLRQHTATKKERAFDIMLADEVSVHEGLQTYNNIVIYLGDETAHVVNREEFYAYCASKGRTYWNHDLSYHNISELEMLLKSRYSIYAVTGVVNGVYRIQPYSTADFYKVRDTIYWRGGHVAGLA